MRNEKKLMERCETLLHPSYGLVRGCYQDGDDEGVLLASIGCMIVKRGYWTVFINKDGKERRFKTLEKLIKVYELEVKK